jgi:hypothetical protein
VPRRRVLWLFALLPALPGCLHLVHPDPPCADEWRPADDLPEEAKSCVYIFLINGLDPFEYCNLAGARDYLHHVGFGKIYYGQSVHLGFFADRIRYIHAHCPESARFVIVGFGRGAGAAQQLALSADAAGIPVDTLIYLAPQGVDAAIDTPAVRIVTVSGDDWLFHSPPAYGGDLMVVQKAGKSAVPTHPETLALLEREVTLVAMSVPPPPRVKVPRVNLVEPIPDPREVIPNPRPLSPEWQFLRPRYPWEELPPTPPKEPEALPPPKVVPQLPPPALSR